MKKLNLAIIGQGRSGKDIHGGYCRSDKNVYYNVRYVVDRDEIMREKAKELYPGCETFADYRELFGKTDIDLVTNATYSNEHYAVAKDLLSHGFNVLTEKPFAKTYYECMDLIETAKKNGVLLAVFHNTQHADFFTDAYKKMKDGFLGKVEQINLRYNGFARRWDWQTLQKKTGGSAYNTGPHPIAMALGFLDFDKNARVAFSRLSTDLTSGDAEDYVKIILTAPGKPVIDIEISAIDAFSGYNLKVMGSKGTLQSTPYAYKLKYIADGENPEKKLVEETLRDENHMPIYCSEKLTFHEEEGKYENDAFRYGTAKIYEDVYYAITENRPLFITTEQAAEVIRVIETAHAENPLPVKFL